MQLQAVIVPPSGAIDGALKMAHDIFSPEPVPEEPKRGLVGRLRKPVPAKVVPELVWVPTPPEALFVRVAKFGNVTLTDTRSLAEAIQRSAANWPSPLLHVASVTVGDTAPFAVVAQLEGDLGGLFGIFTHVLNLGKQQDFFLDRRSFRNEIRLGSVEVPEGAEVPEELPGAVIPLVGPQWRADHLTLFRLVGVGAAIAYEEIAAIALGQPVEDVRDS